ncbi:MAG: phosphoglycerate kinase, partial [Syntrophomonas sp.]|nr:phosphoglycerate kinase [Syntrophomonas sp.]
MRSIRDVELKDKRVLMRVDFNVPMDENGIIIDDTRISAAIPTIEYILGQGARLILMSHLGRPNGKADAKYSLKAVALHLGSLLNKKVLMAGDCIGPEVQEMSRQLASGEVLMLENVRFYPGEEKNDPEFSQQLALLGDIFVNDAFGTAHRAHSSTAGIADFLPAYAGFLLENEVNMLRKVLDHPECPRMAILGGAKVKDKLGLIRNLLNKLDVLLVAGGIGNTFLVARGMKVGKSICEMDLLQECRNLLELADKKNKHIFMPVDVVVASELSADVPSMVVDIDEIPDDMMIVDIGP